jgi:hypothetical protein
MPGGHHSRCAREVSTASTLARWSAVVLMLVTSGCCGRTNQQASLGDHGTVVQCSGPGCVIALSSYPDVLVPADAVVRNPDALPIVADAAARTCSGGIDYRDASDHFSLTHRCGEGPSVAGQYRLVFHNGRSSQYRSVRDETTSVQIRLAPGKDLAINVSTGADATHTFSASYESIAGVFRMPSAGVTWPITGLSNGDVVVVTWDCDATRADCS